MLQGDGADETAFGAVDQSVLALYLLALVGLGFWFARRSRSSDEYFRGGKRVPWWAAGLSIFGTQLSAITFLAIPGLAWDTDWVYFPAQLCILLVAPLVIAKFLPEYRRLNVTTAYEYLEHRFGLAARWTGSVFFLLFQLGRMGVVLYLPSKALATATGMPVEGALLLMGLLCTVYTVLGGIEAVIWSDVLQVVILLFGAAFSLALMIGRLEGGAAGFLESGAEAGKFRTLDWGWSPTEAVVWVVLVGNWFTYLVPYATDQTVIQRYMSTRDERAARRSIWVNGWLSIPASLLFYGLGTGLWAFYRDHPERAAPEMSQDNVLAWFIVQELPVGLSGLVIAAVFAAAMSSIDSSMNSVAAVATTDFAARLRPAMPDAARLRLARWVTVAAGIVATTTALGIAFSGNDEMVDTYMLILSLTSGGIGGLFLLGVFAPSVGQAAALTGTACGAAVSLAAFEYTEVHKFLYGMLGMVACVAVGLALPRLFPGLFPPPGSVAERADPD